MKCIHELILSPGVPGLVTALVIMFAVYCKAWASIPFRPEGYPFDPLPREGESIVRSFEPILARYNRLAEIIIGLGTGSISLLAGSTAFRTTGKLPPNYSSPLVLLAVGITNLVLYIVLQNYWYEMWQHGNPYTHHKYRRVVTFGFSGLLCSAVGYVWFAFALVRS